MKMSVTIQHQNLQDLKAIHGIAQMLAGYFPKPERSMIGIYELLINAVEHGNLGIGFIAKTELVRNGKWEKEINRRLSLPEYADRKVDIVLQQDEQECRLTISDHGEGFSWKDYISREGENRPPNGRGLRIAFDAKFDRILFNPEGNEVTCLVKYQQFAMQDARLLQTA